MSAERDGIDLCASEEGERHRSETGQEHGELSLLDMLRDGWNVAGEGTDKDLDQGNRYADPNAHHGGNQGERHPHEGDQVDVHSSPPTGPAGGGRPASTSESLW